MKRLIYAVALLPLVAHADTWELNNNAGGKIVLQESVCISGGKRYENLRNMFSMAGRGSTITGCWYVSDGWVHVIYNDNSEYTYPANAFRQIKSNYKGTSNKGDNI